MYETEVACEMHERSCGGGSVVGIMILRLRARCMRDRVGVEVWMEVGVNAVCVARGCRGQIMPDTFVAVVRVVEEQLVQRREER